MAVVIPTGVQLTYTGQQIDDAIRSESNSQTDSTSNLALLVPTVGKVVTVQGNGQWLWVDGDTTSVSSSVIASSVSGYGIGEANEGRWIKQFGNAGVATTTSELKDSSPADYFYITLNHATLGGLFFWVDSDTTTEADPDVYESNVVGYRVGDAGEGRWKRIRPTEENVNTLKIVKASQTTVGSAGGASALPATPSVYIPITADDGTEYVVPAYDKS